MDNSRGRSHVRCVLLKMCFKMNLSNKTSRIMRRFQESLISWANILAGELALAISITPSRQDKIMSIKRTQLCCYEFATHMAETKLTSVTWAECSLHNLAKNRLREIFLHFRADRKNTKTASSERSIIMTRTKLFGIIAVLINYSYCALRAFPESHWWRYLQQNWTFFTATSSDRAALSL